VLDGLVDLVEVLGGLLEVVAEIVSSFDEEMRQFARL
jgi:hypothetical protein